MYADAPVSQLEQGRVTGLDALRAYIEALGRQSMPWLGSAVGGESRLVRKRSRQAVRCFHSSPESWSSRWPRTLGQASQCRPASASSANPEWVSRRRVPAPVLLSSSRTTVSPPASPRFARDPRQLDEAGWAELEEPAVVRVPLAFVLGLEEERLALLSAHPDAARPREPQVESLRPGPIDLLSRAAHLAFDRERAGLVQ